MNLTIIKKEIMKLNKKKHALRKKIIEGTKKINLEKKEKNKRIWRNQWRKGNRKSRGKDRRRNKRRD